MLGAGRFFQHLLVAALHRAVALEQIHAIAVAVAEDLDLDVARALQIFLDQYVLVAEAGGRLALARRQGVEEVLAPLHRAHALAAATGRGLDQHRVADPVRLQLEEVGFLLIAVIAGRERHAGLLHQLLGFRLAAHGADGRHRRADENQAVLRAGLGEFLVLGEEAVAGMDGLGAGGQRRGDDLVHHQIGLARRRRADTHGLVGQAHVARAFVGLGIHGDGADAHAPAVLMTRQAISPRFAIRIFSVNMASARCDPVGFALSRETPSCLRALRARRAGA